MLDFRYAEIGKSGDREYIYYYAKNPDSGKLERRRIYLNNIKTKANRIRYAKRLVNHINNKLDHGWNPFIDDSENKKKYTFINEALDFAYKYKLKYIRKTSVGNYKHRMAVLKEWLKQKGKLKGYIFEFTEDLSLSFMNNLLMEKDIKGRTYNNYLIDYRTFFNLLVKNKYLVTNPFHAVEKLPETETSKRPFTDQELEAYMTHVKKYDQHFYIISLYIYYCGLRPAEVCRLRVGDINLNKGLIYISGTESKNKKVGVIPVVDDFKNILNNYLNKYPNEYYICGKGLQPGPQFTYPTRIAEKFRAIAEYLNISKDVKIYALKDTAADKLIEAGYDAKVIRDLFRHSNIAITNEYLKKFNPHISERLIKEFPKPGI